MIKSSASIKNLWLSKSAHLNALLVNGFVSKRAKATALSLVENLDESPANGNGLNGSNNNSNGKAKTALTANSGTGNNNNSNNGTTNLTEAKQQTYYNNTVWLDDRSKYGHTGKELQEKIAAEKRLRAAPLLNLVFANRKLSFYDTSHTPGRDDGMRHREQEQRNAEDVLFDMFYNEETGLISMGKFLAALKTTGIRRSDPRIRELMENLKKVHKLSNYETGSSAETQNLNRETFKAVVAQNIVLIAKAFRQQFIIPDFVSFVKDVEDIYWKCKTNADGAVANYIPQLARYSSDSWGVSICTIDGQRYSIGDVDIPFTLQSCSKPLTYAIALEKLGPKVVHSYVGQEPSGRNFNELVLDHNNKPHNPMINAGAILTCSLLQALIKPDMTAAEKFDYTLQWFKRLSGGENIGFNNAVFLSEREAADRNYALGFYMRENKCYPKRTNLKEVMDFYFQCCSMETTCEAMSVIAATLANGGICPTTEEKVLRPEVVRDVLSIMHSCGTYDYSGQFAFKVGLPAKSGVSGGMMLVIPNVMGIFTWSPPLDKLGNSVRGVQFCEELVSAFNFHRYDNLKHASDKKDPRKHRYETKGLSIVNLLFSAASGDVTALRRHRLSGMDITLADYDGRTALHLAASEGHLDCVKFLLEHCQVPHNPKDRWGNLPVDEAENFGHHVIVDYLKEWAEKAEAAEAHTPEAVIKNTEADEEIITSNQSISSDYDRSATASPIPSDTGSSSGIDDNTKPGF
ncbi:PREDICTED: glutaminase liver isoform, mitochondrial isoform X2 [Bactrocera latifrons]|uniref:glutaminase n=1 Tax=Bactrocera latifrons TaxID=174628 RepID=A0A0K8VPT7_BACLA|nr:PREDICTED: glutaminase liver isoform, mitochondrial isoform X2 [Bactrocera latifrons]